MFHPASRHVKYFHPVFSAVNGHVRVHSFSPGSESTVLVPGYSEYKQTIDCTVACSIDQIWNCGLRCGILLIRLWANVLSPIKLACFKNLYMHVSDRKEDPTSKEIVWIVVASSLKFLFCESPIPLNFLFGAKHDCKGSEDWEPVHIINYLEWIYWKWWCRMV